MKTKLHFLLRITILMLCVPIVRVQLTDVQALG